MSTLQHVSGVHDDDLVAHWRSCLGAGASLWANRVEVEPGWWLAFSGVKSVDFNAILCHGRDGARDLGLALEAVRDAKVPAVIAVGGPALGFTNLLADAEWVCVGARPFEVMREVGGEADPAVRRLGAHELAPAHDIVAGAFDLTPAMAELALSGAGAGSSQHEVWGIFEDAELRACVGVVAFDDVMAIWSLATPPALRRRGYGRRLMSAVHAAKRDDGVRTSLLWASPDAEALYRKLGYTIVEYHQVWSRRRWIFPPV
jgi:GNAT superfamily N-acetyltransferase